MTAVLAVVMVVCAAAGLAAATITIWVLFQSWRDRNAGEDDS